MYTHIVVYKRAYIHIHAYTQAYLQTYVHTYVQTSSERLQALYESRAMEEQKVRRLRVQGCVRATQGAPHRHRGHQRVARRPYVAPHPRHSMALIHMYMKKFPNINFVTI